MQLTFVLVICSVLFFQNCSDEKQTVAEYKSRPSVSTARSNRVLPDTANAVYKFLKYHFPVVYQVETGTEVFFRDEFLEIPDSLQVKLKNFFPDFEFKIAKMAFMHWGPEDVNLALILERDFFNQRVYHINSYAWSIWFNGDLPFSFRNLLNHHSLVSLNKKVDFYQHVDALAKLLAFASNLKFFKTYKTGGDIIAEFEYNNYVSSLLTFREQKSRHELSMLALEGLDKRSLQNRKLK